MKELLNQIDNQIAQSRENKFENSYSTIDKLPLTYNQKLCVLEWLAYKLIEIDEKTGGAGMNGCKSYDPLTIHDEVANSYVFNLEDGGRHHSFRNLTHLEQMLMDETIQNVRESILCGSSLLEDER